VILEMVVGVGVILKVFIFFKYDIYNTIDNISLSEIS